MQHSVVFMYGRIPRLQKLLLTSTSPLDRRGMNDAQKKIPADWIQQVKNHIDSFPKKETHYGTTTHRYLPAELNVKTMYLHLV